MPMFAYEGEGYLLAYVGKLRLFCTKINMLPMYTKKISKYHTRHPLKNYKRPIGVQTVML